MSLVESLDVAQAGGAGGGVLLHRRVGGLASGEHLLLPGAAGVGEGSGGEC